jgi:hypothetical protein
MEGRRYTLVPVPAPDGRAPASPGVVRRRYAIARVAPTSRSALGIDRLERLEQIAALDREREGERPAEGENEDRGRR